MKVQVDNRVNVNDLLNTFPTHAYTRHEDGKVKGNGPETISSSHQTAVAALSDQA